MCGWWEKVPNINFLKDNVPYNCKELWTCGSQFLELLIGNRRTDWERQDRGSGDSHALIVTCEKRLKPPDLQKSCSFVCGPLFTIDKGSWSFFFFVMIVLNEYNPGAKDYESLRSRIKSKKKIVQYIMHGLWREFNEKMNTWLEKHLVTMIFYSCLPFGKSHRKNGTENITSSQCLSSEGRVMLTSVGAIAFIGVS